MNVQMDRTSIAALIPHAGLMCLLDCVVSWNSTTIACLASSHRMSGNPLAREGRLDAICGVEYAAQAMAVHGGLTGDGRRPAAGYLASVRDVVWSVERLDLLKDDLLVTAELLIADTARGIYRFKLTCGDTTVLSGRAAVVIEAGRFDSPPQ
jgi:predicted hotdog family 3-hydroxylacyl-ACP dehydratase